MDPLKPEDYEPIIRAGLQEDAPGGDITTLGIFGPDDSGEAALIAKAPGVIAGLPVAARVFTTLDPDFIFSAEIADGERVTPGQRIAGLRGRVRALLTGERLALNLLQRMSGIATLAAAYVEAVKGLPVTILDTRKTAPGLRALDKYAVRVGGATNHRATLSDLAMIKDNHLKLAGGIAAAVTRIRREKPGLRVEVETENLDDVGEALAAGADIIMLDNMDLATMRSAVARINGRARTEASGNVRLDNVRAIAETGVDSISIGALTHSVTALDISLKA
ncbi:MAG TPA: carboxylating nicotinate-nucleotide diphosphorylase [Kiritimatiellia bacterium]|nr:carboxylating nicotinate-nucleotide diphosphorylase [Kiritimatiellia bacterium]HMO99861.1 carboxylating nicotinate-nucleotide diphosphorylase [Kiritimatiellia bacterium]HMP96373.1 carboxylating nicotinate-nucleotide diphosphorylase [Kiritimatiellia bacterium]